MSNFLKNLLQIQTSEYSHETSKWIYKIKYLSINIDLFVIEFSLSLTYWITRQSFEERDRFYNEYLEKIFAQFDLTGVVEPAPKKKAKKPEVKKPVAKKKTKK